jgi:hypothetical protein
MKPTFPRKEYFDQKQREGMLWTEKRPWDIIISKSLVQPIG